MKSTGVQSWRPTYVSSRVNRRRFLRGAAAGAGAAAILACGGSSSGTDSGLKLDDSATSRQPGTVWFEKNDWKLADETKQAVRGGIYRSFRSEDLPSHFDPIPQPNSAVPSADQTYEMLMGRNRGPGVEPGSDAYNTPIGALAQSWEISPDAATYTFTLRPNVKWHPITPVNGRVMDIDDWRTSYERFNATGLYKTAWAEAGLDSVTFPDTTHMVAKFKVPFVPMIDRIWDSTFGFFILPKELNANPSLAEKQPIGTGYQIMDRHTPSVSIEFRKHPGYWGGDPFIDRWVQPILPEYANAYAQFVQGNVISLTPTAKDVMQLRKDVPGAVIVAEAIPENEVTRHKWGRNNPSAFPWKDARVRIAMRKSVNYHAIGEFLSNKADFEANGVPVEIRTMSHVMQVPSYWLDPDQNQLGEASKNYMFDVAEAKKLLSAAGHTGPVTLPYYVNTLGALPDAEQLVQDSLKAAGTFNVELNQIAANEYRTRINVDGKYDGTQQQSGASGNDIDYVLFRDYHSSRVGGVAFPDAKMDQLCEAQRREPDAQKRIAIIKEIQMYLAQNMLMNPGRSLYTTFSFRWPWLHNSNFGGFGESSPGGAQTGLIPQGSPIAGGHLLWLDKDMPNRDRPV